MINVWVTRSALERLRRHRPGLDIRDVQRLLAAARSLAPVDACALLGRPRGQAGDEYYLTGDGAGVLVVAPSVVDRSGRSHVRPRAVVTYLPLSPAAARSVAA